MRRFTPPGMGWHQDLPDGRDHTYRHPEIRSWLRRLRPLKEFPDQIDLRYDSDGSYFTQVEDQGMLNSSTAFAVLSLVEYFERRISGRTFDGSKLFLYQLTRKWLANGKASVGDPSVDLRTTLKVLMRIGVPPEEYWAYAVDKLDQEPSAFLYGRCQTFNDLHYFRLDEPNSDGATTWSTVRAFLAAGFPVVFGFPVPASLSCDGNISYRPSFDSIRGGQAVVAVGYSANHFGRGKEAILIRSSWGTQWGDNGHGWLPASCVRDQRARDFWSLASVEWLESPELSRPHLA